MKNSVLQFANPTLTELKYKVNKNFNSEGPIKLKIRLETRVNKCNENNSAIVEVRLKVFSKKEFEEAPFYIHVSMQGEFRWENDIDNKVLEKLLKSNAPSIILSYLRPYVSTLTTGSGFDPLILPLLDLTENEVIYDESLK
ncbi:protein-export chaperone SecB [Clostridium paraputrificum]|uniref:protein-export chaperone SecB n=1 Tax=Clostridium paraputrificum TaxID=29363 RepID=UPI000408D9FC|nr:protein-export chaperone SecB [Clostridium paraputrificum]